MLQERIEESKKKSAEQDKEIQNFLSSEKSLDITQLEELTKISIEECNAMRRKIDTAEKNLLQAETTLKERERNIEQHLQATTKPSEEENIESLTLQLQEFKQQATLRLEQITQITAKLKTDKENKQRYQKLLKEYKEKEKYAYDWKCLCEAFGSAKGEKFRLIAQGYTLDIMLSYANMHLKQLSSRYQLVRTAPDSLALMIIDLDMLSEQRTINTLSGGETFLVSLAMALALSSLSSSNMNIESLFIDEGFGSLDSETLRVAMDALEHLQSQGRKVGVISHLSNMIERIPTQICVTKKRGGRSTVEIKSNY
jgi:exonuclease SbcC